MGVSTVSGWPTWVVLLAFAGVFLVVMFGARWALSRHGDEERRSELSGLAGSLNGPVGASLAFLVGFAVSITYGSMSAAQTSVERIASQAQQTSLLASDLDPGPEQVVNTDMVVYLRAIADQDRLVLADEETSELPSFPALEKFQRDVRDLQAAATDDQASVLKTVQGNVVTLAGSQADLNGVARRGLPAVVLQLLVLVGCLSAACVGMLAVGIRRPYLIAGWALVIAMGITVVIALYNPFAGSVSITYDPIEDAIDRIANG